MDNTTRRNLNGLAQIAAGIVVAAGIVWGLVVLAESQADAGLTQTQAKEQAEEAFVHASARAMNVDPDTVDREAAIAGGYNACHMVDVYGLDKRTLAGWEEHWHQRWEGGWLRAAVDLLCPPGGAR